MPNGPVLDRLPGLCLLSNKTITVVVLEGSSKGLKLELTKQKTSIGRVGGGADVEINDHRASVLHCVLHIVNEMIRLYDLDSANGTYVNDERIQAANLDHFSEFRVGSTAFLLTIVPNHLQVAT